MERSKNKRSRKDVKPVGTPAQPSIVVKVDVSSSSLREVLAGWQGSARSNGFEEDLMVKALHVRNKRKRGLKIPETMPERLERARAVRNACGDVGDVTAEAVHNATDVPHVTP